MKTPLPANVTVSDITEHYWDAQFEVGGDLQEHVFLVPDETWVVRRIYVDRCGPGSNFPADWGNVRVRISNEIDHIQFESHVADIARPLGDLGEEIAKLLSESDELLQRIGANPERFASRVVPYLAKPILCQKAQNLRIRLDGELLVPVRVVLQGLRKRTVT